MLFPPRRGSRGWLTVALQRRGRRAAMCQEVCWGGNTSLLLILALQQTGVFGRSLAGLLTIVPLPCPDVLYPSKRLHERLRKYTHRSSLRTPQGSPQMPKFHDATFNIDPFLPNKVIKYQIHCIVAFHLNFYII